MFISLCNAYLFLYTLQKLGILEEENVHESILSFHVVEQVQAQKYPLGDTDMRGNLEIQELLLKASSVICSN